MKRCLQCEFAFADVGWSCPECGHAPQIVDGFLAFAPALSSNNEDLFPQTHAQLDYVQGGSFWFRARNRLITYFVRQYARDAGAALEIGCGTGYVTAALRAVLPQARLCGSEIDAGALSFAQRRLGTGVELFQMDARALPFVEEFDLVCAFDVLEHIHEDNAVLAEIHRALKPNGVALLAVPQHPWLWGPADDHARHKRRYRRHELAEKCGRAALSVEFETSFVSSLLPLMAASRLLSRSRKTYRPAAELMLPAWLDRPCEAMLDGERLAIRAGARFPVGGSRFVVARRRAAGPDTTGVAEQRPLAAARGVATRP